MVSRHDQVQKKSEHQLDSVSPAILERLLGMAPLRIRYAKGTTNLDVDLDAGTVLDLQQAILRATQIPPSQQEGESCFMLHTDTKYGTKIIL